MGNIRHPHLTSDNDLGKTEESMETVVQMTEALQASPSLPWAAWVQTTQRSFSAHGPA
jgi:hypothetical protein